MFLRNNRIDEAIRSYEQQLHSYNNDSSSSTSHAGHLKVSNQRQGRLCQLLAQLYLAHHKMDGIENADKYFQLAMGFGVYTKETRRFFAIKAKQHRLSIQSSNDTNVMTEIGSDKLNETQQWTGDVLKSKSRFKLNAWVVSAKRPTLPASYMMTGSNLILLHPNHVEYSEEMKLLLQLEEVEQEKSASEGNEIGLASGTSEEGSDEPETEFERQYRLLSEQAEREDSK